MNKVTNSIEPRGANPAVGNLFSGALDIVGDIHGEITALKDLLLHLGYDDYGAHPRGRRLIFVGDLCDRGPDSPDVIKFVSALVERDLAQCVLGNHELNLLCEAHKDGNGWYFDNNHDHIDGKFLNSRSLHSDDRKSVRSFLSSLPLALQRDDLRIVHAAWHQPSIDGIRQSDVSIVEFYNRHETLTKARARESGISAKADAELSIVASKLKDKSAELALLPNVAALDELTQGGNPIRIVTSGLERVAQKTFFASGKWRMVDRVAWWNEYTDSIPVIFGHYWRWPTDNARAAHSRGEPDLFVPAKPNQLLGPKRNTFCVDFAVGARYKERPLENGRQFDCRLAAVRWPERELVFDDGERSHLD